ncbi:reverse transcriptase domain-containing protein [Tanacetum coccineum]
MTGMSSSCHPDNDARPSSTAHSKIGWMELPHVHRAITCKHENLGYPWRKLKEDVWALGKLVESSGARSVCKQTSSWSTKKWRDIQMVVAALTRARWSPPTLLVPLMSFSLTHSSRPKRPETPCFTLQLALHMRLFHRSHAASMTKIEGQCVMWEAFLGTDSAHRIESLFAVYGYYGIYLVLLANANVESANLGFLSNATLLPICGSSFLDGITLLVKVEDDEHSTSAWMDFMMVRSTSPHNGIIGRPGLRKIQAVPSTTHRIIKFPVTGGILTLKSSKIIPVECAMVSGPEEQPISVNKVREERVKVAINPEHPEQTVMIGSNLTDKTREKLCNLLQRSLDIFAWTPADMTGVPRHIAKHRLNVRKGCQPVRQKKKGQAVERNIAINDEVSKLVTAGIMREVHYHDWLSNPVMVKKSDNSWRMCADFKDLNKAYPKDGYPLLEIDWKVESLCGFPFKCFLDAYKGYHQIQMAEEDEEKTAFITNQGIFCYTKILFGLRNAGATYQRLVDKAFYEQIGRNLEVYVDDLVIKSRTDDEIVRDIEETFKTLRKINMKLNPKKCTFGVEEGMFLGYQVNTKGTKICPDKVDAVLSLQSPKCLKDVQKLNGKLASLNRFLAKSAEKSLPFFKTLKKCTKKSDFLWTGEAEAAFRQMKEHIAKLPMLTAPEEQEELIIYLAASKEAVSDLPGSI